MKGDLEQIKKEIITRRVKKGQSIQTILNWLIAEYGYGQARAYQLIQEARAELGEAFQKHYQNRLADQVMLMETMVEQAITDKDRRGALEIMKEIHKVSQMYIDKLDVTSAGEPISKIVFEVINKNGTEDKID
jgi:hypothetical protein